MPRTSAPLRRPFASRAAILALGAAACWWIAPALAQEQPDANGDGRDDVTNRRLSNGQPVVLAFNETPVKDLIDFIMQVTGKTVIPDSTILTPNYKVTVVNDIPMSQNEALDQLFVAMYEKRIGVIEGDKWIKMMLRDQITQADAPVIPASMRLANRTDEGVIVNKVFQPRYASAETLQGIIDELRPDDFGTVQIEANTNSIIVLTTLGIAKKMEALIDALDNEGLKETRTFRLNYADAETVAQNIISLFGESASTGSTGGARTPTPGRPTIPGRPGGGAETGGGGSAPGVTPPSVVADTRNNSVTVVADPEVLDRIESLILDEWDRKPIGEVVKLYTIKYRDVIKVRDMLNTFGGGGSASGATGGQGRVIQPGGAQAGGEGSGGTTRLSNLYSFEADTSANQLIAIAKTDVSFDLIDSIIEKLDQPGDADMPLYVELKHADAEELAQEINILYSPDGIRQDIRGRAQGLEEFESLGEASTDTGTTGGTTGGGTTQDNTISFWWQLNRPDATVGPVSSVIGRVRVMPVYRTNAVMVLGAPHYKNHVAQLIDQLDRPGRQVLITAVIAEVQLDDALSLGLRWGRADTFGSQDNQIGGSGSIEATENDILSSIFDTSVLNVDVDIAAVLNLLKTESNVRILSQPRIFTADNEQANFLDGQDIQFVEDSISDIQTGNLNQSFEFRTVGIVLSVRPRITVNRDVDMEVALELSSLSPNATAQAGAIIDQRRTTTRVIMKNRQTIVISGILREQESDIKRKIPLLGDIPLLGALFTSTDRGSVRSELIAFITPIVVDNPDELEELNRPMRERGRDLQRSLQEQVDDPDTGEVWDSISSPRQPTADDTSAPGEGG